MTGPAHHQGVTVRALTAAAGQKGDADYEKGGCDQTAFPRFGRLVSVANGGQCNLKREAFRHGASREEVSDVSAELYP